MASQLFSWLTAQLLKLRFAVEPHAPPGLFARGDEGCLILTPTHQTVLDPWLIMSGRLPIGEFAPGAVYLQRQSGAGIVPMGEGRR